MYTGGLTQERCDAIRPFVKGKTVIDLGAGSLSLSLLLRGMGASRVLAVDKEPMDKYEGIDIAQKYFSDVKDTLDVAFLSRPINHFCEGLNEILDRHETVIYLGSNIDGFACGSLQLFKYLVQRNPIFHMFDGFDTILVYSKEPRTESLYAEEVAAIDAWLGGSVMTRCQAQTYNDEYR